MEIHPTFHISKVKPQVESPLVPAFATPPFPRIVEGEPVSAMDILDPYLIRNFYGGGCVGGYLVALST